jgi:hypothetical protein
MINEEDDQDLDNRKIDSSYIWKSFDESITTLLEE